MKHTCPGCGAEFDCVTGQATFPPQPEPETPAPDIIEVPAPPQPKKRRSMFIDR